MHGHLSLLIPRRGEPQRRPADFAGADGVGRGPGEAAGGVGGEPRVDGSRRAGAPRAK